MTKPKESLPLPPLVYDVSQAAKVLSVSEHVIENLIKTEQVQVIRLGRSRRIPVKSLEALVARLAGEQAAS